MYTWNIHELIHIACICMCIYAHMCIYTHVRNICMCIYVCTCILYIKHIYTLGICLFYFIFSNREENETSCGNKLVQNMLELSVFTCTKRLLLIRRRAVWTLGHMHLESWNVLLLGRIVHWLVDKAISCLLEASVISVPPFTLSLKKD